MVEILCKDARRGSIVTVESIKTDKKGVNKKEQSQHVADFEEAISASGFGKFNILLLLCALPGYTTAVYVTSALSYIITSAECDLHMTMADMGTLNIITYMGMMTSALLWGFLSDTLGRKKIMVWGFLTLGIFEVMASQSQSFWSLIILKFVAGFIFNGPFAVLIAYISELHPASIRTKILVYGGIYYGISNINLPLLAWSIIPSEWNITIIEDIYVLHSWHVFLLVCALPPLASGFASMLLPESPKFLMSRGRNDEALEVFKKIYSINTGKSPDTYPIKQLVEETAGGKLAPQGLEALKQGFKQIRPLSVPPYLTMLILVCSINSGAMLGGNTLRLWFPQMATIVDDFNAKNSESQSLCNIIDDHVANKSYASVEIDNVMDDCIAMEPSTTMYINSIIIGIGSLICYGSGGMIVNVLGKKKLAAISMFLSSICSLALYWTTTVTQIVVLFTIFVSATGVAGTALSSVVVDLFPTSMRAMAVAIFLMLGRMGTVTGGLLFPLLLSTGCVFPFILIATITFVGALLCYFIPKTIMKSLE